MIRVKLGSESALKLGALRKALELLGLEAVIAAARVGSGVPNQPYGEEQTLQGATTRAGAVHEPGNGFYAIGIENGLVPTDAGVVDIAYICVITPSGKRVVRKSYEIPVPQELVDASLASGQTLTAGKLESDRSGSDPADAYPVWSKGQTTREKILTSVLFTAMLSATIAEEGETP